MCLYEPFFWRSLQFSMGITEIFWLIKTAVPVKIFRYSFHVFSCACPTVISSISGKSFHFPFPHFVIFVLQYFPFHVVWNGIQLLHTIYWKSLPVEQTFIMIGRLWDYSIQNWTFISRCISRPSTAWRVTHESGIVQLLQENILWM